MEKIVLKPGLKIATKLGGLEFQPGLKFAM